MKMNHQNMMQWMSFLELRGVVEKLQGGTGQHLDGNVLDGPIEDGGRPFQAQVVLRSQLVGDGSLQVVPGFHWFAREFFKHAGGPLPPGEYFSLRADIHDNIRHPDCWWYVRRVPDAWNPTDYVSDPGRARSCVGIAKLCKQMYRELSELPESLPPQEGDYILWDPRLLHSTGEPNELNCTGQVRQTFYCAYRHASPSSKYVAQEQFTFRVSGEHPAWGATSHSNVEMHRNYTCSKLTELGKRLYGVNPWMATMTSADRRARRAQRRTEGFDQKEVNAPEKDFLLPREDIALTPRLISFFRRYGFVVVPNVVSVEKTRSLRKEIENFVQSRYSINLLNHKTIHATLTLPRLRRLISSYGSGMVELFWLHAMDEIRTDQHVYSVFSLLLEKTWALGDRPFQTQTCIDNPRRLLIYSDRCNIRFPASMLEECCCGGRPEGTIPNQLDMCSDELEVNHTKDKVGHIKRTLHIKRRNSNGGDRLMVSLKRKRRALSEDIISERLYRSSIEWLPDRSSLEAVASMRQHMFGHAAICFLSSLKDSVSSMAQRGLTVDSNYDEFNETCVEGSCDCGTTQWLKRRKLNWNIMRSHRKFTVAVSREKRILEECQSVIDRLISDVCTHKKDHVHASSRDAPASRNVFNKWLSHKKGVWGSQLAARRILKMQQASYSLDTRLSSSFSLPTRPPQLLLASQKQSSIITNDSGLGEVHRVAGQFQWIFNVFNWAALHGDVPMPSPREIVAVFYEKLNPEKLRSANELCTLYTGKENKLYSLMESKYGFHPLDVMASSVSELNLNRKLQAIVSDMVAVIEDKMQG